MTNGNLSIYTTFHFQIQSTRGSWWLARTSNGKSGYCPADCLESYVPSPAGLPRTTIPGERPRRDADTGSVYSSASVRPRERGRDYRDGRHDRDRDYDRRDRNDDRRDGCRDRSRYDRPDVRDSHSIFGTQRGLPTGTQGFGNAAGLGTGTNFGLGPAGLSTPLVGNGFGTVGPTSGFSTISSATGANLFPNGFTQGTLRGNPIPLGTPGLASVGGGVPLRAPSPFVAQGLANPAGVGFPTVGTNRLAGNRPTQLNGLGGVQLGNTQFTGAQLGGAQLGGTQLGGTQLGGFGPYRL